MCYIYINFRAQFPDKDPYSQSYGFSSSHVQMCELDHKEGWVWKNWCCQIVVLEKTLESPLDGQGDQTLSHWCEELTHWKRPWCSERLEAGEEGDNRGDGWMALLIQWTWVWVTLGDCKGQGRLVCCSPWGHKESDTTERLNNNNRAHSQYKSSSPPPLGF